MKSVAVYCGASSGTNEAFTQQAQAMGQALAERAAFPSCTAGAGWA